MEIERTFVMLKPGVLPRRLMGEIIQRLERKGLKIIAMKIMRLTTAMAESHYDEHREKPFFPELIEYITSGPVVAMAIEGNEVIKLVRLLCGATAVTNAQPGTIRGDYALHTNKNIIHASDSPESAERELKLYFTDADYIDWESGDECWF